MNKNITMLFAIFALFAMLSGCDRSQLVVAPSSLVVVPAVMTPDREEVRTTSRSLSQVLFKISNPYRERIHFNRDGKFYLREVYIDKNSWDIPELAEIVTQSGRRIYSTTNSRLFIVNDRVVQRGDGSDAELVFIDNITQPPLLLSDVFGEAVVGVVAVANDGSMAAVVGAGRELLQRAPDGSQVRHSAISTPMPNHMLWLENSAYFLITCGNDDTYVIDKNGMVINKYNNMVVWKKTGFGNNQFIISNSRGFWLAKCNNSGVVELDDRIDRHAKSCVQAESSGSLIWFRSPSRGDILYKRTGDGDYRSYELPRGQLVGWIRIAE